MVLLLLVSPRIAMAAERSSGRVPDGGACLNSIGTARLPARMPAPLVRAIATVEAGRFDGASHRVLPWAWTINVNGVGYFYATKAQAVAAVHVLQNAGIRSIDVGCMQINLMYHPDAFASLDEAFEPSVNVAYAVRFLSTLFHQTGSWEAATAAYHSQNPQRGSDYEKRVMALYPMKPPAAAEPVEVAEAVDPTAPTDGMRRLRQENQEDHAHLLALFGPVALAPHPAAASPAPARGLRHILRALVATRKTDGTLRIADSSWLDGASRN